MHAGWEECAVARYECGGAEERLVMQRTNACELERGGDAGARSKCLGWRKGAAARCMYGWVGEGVRPDLTLTEHELCSRVPQGKKVVGTIYKLPCQLKTSL